MKVDDDRFQQTVKFVTKKIRNRVLLKPGFSKMGSGLTHAEWAGVGFSGRVLTRGNFLQNGATPLHFAANQGYNAILKMLLDAGADKNAKRGVRGDFFLLVRFAEIGRPALCLDSFLWGWGCLLSAR